MVGCCRRTQPATRAIEGGTSRRLPPTRNKRPPGASWSVLELVGRERELDGGRRGRRTCAPAAAACSACSARPGSARAPCSRAIAERAAKPGCSVLEGRAAEHERDVPFGARRSTRSTSSRDLHPRGSRPSAPSSRAVLRRRRGRPGAPAAPGAGERFRYHRALRSLLELLGARAAGRAAARRPALGRRRVARARAAPAAPPAARAAPAGVRRCARSTRRRGCWTRRARTPAAQQLALDAARRTTRRSRCWPTCRDAGACASGSRARRRGNPLFLQRARARRARRRRRRLPATLLAAVGWRSAALPDAAARAARRRRGRRRPVRPRAGGRGRRPGARRRPPLDARRRRPRPRHGRRARRSRSATRWCAARSTTPRPRPGGWPRTSGRRPRCSARGAGAGRARLPRRALRAAGRRGGGRGAGRGRRGGRRTAPGDRRALVRRGAAAAARRATASAAPALLARWRTRSPSAGRLHEEPRGARSRCSRCSRPSRPRTGSSSRSRAPGVEKLLGRHARRAPAAARRARRRAAPRGAPSLALEMAAAGVLTPATRRELRDWSAARAPPTPASRWCCAPAPRRSARSATLCAGRRRRRGTAWLDRAVGAAGASSTTRRSPRTQRCRYTSAGRSCWPSASPTRSRRSTARCRSPARRARARLLVHAARRRARWRCWQLLDLDGALAEVEAAEEGARLQGVRSDAASRCGSGRMLHHDRGEVDAMPSARARRSPRWRGRAASALTRTGACDVAAIRERAGPGARHPRDAARRRRAARGRRPRRGAAGCCSRSCARRSPPSGSTTRERWAGELARARPRRWACRPAPCAARLARAEVLLARGDARRGGRAGRRDGRGRRARPRAAGRARRPPARRPRAGRRRRDAAGEGDAAARGGRRRPRRRAAPARRRRARAAPARLARLGREPRAAAPRPARSPSASAASPSSSPRALQQAGRGRAVPEREDGREHLTRVYAKLGVRSRTQLARAHA